MTRAAALCAAAALVMPGLASAQAHRGLNLQATPTPSPLLPLPPQPPGVVPPQSGPEFLPAPTPNRDAAGPLAPRASGAPELSPSIITRGRQYRGEGYSAGSTAQDEQERRAKPGAGFNLRMPLQPQ